MYINQILELSMVLDNEKFQKVLGRVRETNYLEKNEGEYIDRSLETKGIVVFFRDSQYKKKISLLINSGLVLDCDKPDPVKLIRKLDKRIGGYLGFKYRMEDFDLSWMILSTDIDVHNRENVAAYLKVLQRIGKVKGFSLSDYKCFDDIGSFCLEGNSNGIEFLIYNLEDYVARRLGKADIGRKKLKSLVKESGGILRTEVRLTKPKAIREYSDALEVCRQAEELLRKGQDIFFDIFARIIPFGDFYKKDKAVEIIRSKVEDVTLRRRMLRLVALIPEKKSLYLAQKAMNWRNVGKAMDMFAKINVSPVTISKRHDVKCLKNIYEYLIEGV